MLAHRDPFYSLESLNIALAHFRAISLLRDTQIASGYYTSPKNVMHILAHVPLCPHGKVSPGHVQRSKWLVKSIGILF